MNLERYNIPFREPTYTEPLSVQVYQNQKVPTTVRGDTKNIRELPRLAKAKHPVREELFQLLLSEDRPEVPIRVQHVPAKAEDGGDPK
jgi:hypothetical protein